jgi:RNA polymerase sigma factor (sigma-70 family)
MASKNQINYSLLLQLLQQKEDRNKKKAFQYLRRSSKKLVYHIVLKNGGSELEAENVFEETVEEVFQKILTKEYDQKKASLVTFVSAVAKNKWLYKSRSNNNRRKQERRFLELQQDNTGRNLNETDFTEEQFQKMVHALQSLGEPCLSIISQYYLKGKKLKDVAKELGITEDAVKQRRKRCIEKLKIKFGL